MSSEAILHSLELFHTIDALGFLLAVYEARERLPELGTARTVSHATQARAIPVDFSRDRIERGRSSVLFLLLALWCGFTLDGRGRGGSSFVGDRNGCCYFLSNNFREFNGLGFNDGRCGNGSWE